ncbi:hypothetical protein JB92DRAFT_2917762 [Gautieria morchelliformis]|nr:hypothetical protein JB92DRAFT_2917762 [Gautieria morchelliformis]
MAPVGAACAPGHGVCVGRDGGLGVAREADALLLGPSARAPRAHRAAHAPRTLARAAPAAPAAGRRPARLRAALRRVLEQRAAAARRRRGRRHGAQARAHAAVARGEHGEEGALRGREGSLGGRAPGGVAGRAPCERAERARGRGRRGGERRRAARQARALLARRRADGARLGVGPRARGRDCVRRRGRDRLDERLGRGLEGRRGRAQRRHGVERAVGGHGGRRVDVGVSALRRGLCRVEMGRVRTGQRQTGEWGGYRERIRLCDGGGGGGPWGKPARGGRRQHGRRAAAGRLGERGVGAAAHGLGHSSLDELVLGHAIEGGQGAGKAAVALQEAVLEIAHATLVAAVEGCRLLADDDAGFAGRRGLWGWGWATLGAGEGGRGDDRGARVRCGVAVEDLGVLRGTGGCNVFARVFAGPEAAARLDTACAVEEAAAVGVDATMREMLFADLRGGRCDGGGGGWGREGPGRRRGRGLSGYGGRACRRGADGDDDSLWQDTLVAGGTP